MGIKLSPKNWGSKKRIFIVASNKDTLEEAHEPFLLRCGYLEKTPRGRQIPAKQLLHFKKIFLNK